MRFIVPIAAFCLVAVASTASADWFSCWPQSPANMNAVKTTSHEALGVTLKLGADWSLETGQVRFMASFKHTNGSLLTVSRQHRAESGDILTKLEGRELGRPWLGPECHELLKSWLPHLKDVEVRAYRSLIKMRTWSADLVVVFPDGDDWIVVRLRERWRKHQQRLSSGEVERIVKSLKTAGET